MFEQALKIAALFFLVQAILVYIASASVERLLAGIAPPGRARFAFFSLIAAVLAAAGFTTLMAALARTGAIGMVTPYFHGLMHGGGELAILLSGTAGMALSLLTSYLFVRGGGAGIRGARPAENYCGLPVATTAVIRGAALVGAIRPFIAVSDSLAGESRDIALAHEHAHYILGHNWMKLGMRALLRLNMMNLPLHRLARVFPLLCEYECDAAVAKSVGEEAYKIGLTELCAGEIDSAFQGERLAALGVCPTPAANKGFGTLALSYGIAFAAVLIPVAAMLVASVPRCAVICFLGY
ncbi:MAG: hypothetical protein HRF49_03145 [bacterium]